MRKHLILIIFSVLLLSSCGLFLYNYYDEYTYDDPVWMSDGTIIYRWIVEKYRKSNAINAKFNLYDRYMYYLKMSEEGTNESYVSYNNRDVGIGWEDFKLSFSPQQNYFAIFGKLVSNSLVVDPDVDKDFKIYSWPIVIFNDNFVFYGEDVEWSPAEDQLIVLNSADNHLWITDISGESKVEILAEACQDFAWGSGDKIAFTYNNAGSTGFSFIGPDGTGRQDLPSGEGVSEPYISRIDSNNIYGVRDGSLVRMDVSNILSPSYTVLIGSFEGTDLRLSSDESKVVFTRDDGIWAVNIDGTELRQLRESGRVYND